MIVAEYIWNELKEFVDTVFFLPGGGSMYLVEELGKSGLRYISALHEQQAGYMAIGYAMLHGLGVCCTTSGPGAANAVSPCAAAWADSIPVLFISGQAKTSTLKGATELRTRGVQEIDIVKVVAPITKKAVQILDEYDIAYLLPIMIKECMYGRPGPCWLDIPMDVQNRRLP